MRWPPAQADTLNQSCTIFCGFIKTPEMAEMQGENGEIRTFQEPLLHLHPQIPDYG